MHPEPTYWKAKLRLYNIYDEPQDIAAAELTNPTIEINAANGWQITNMPDFRPKNGAAIIDQGVTFEGFIADEVVNEPDAGSYKHGGTNWIPGYQPVPRWGIAAALIQSNFGSQGNFEVVVQEGTRLCHYWRANDKPDEHFPWSDSTACFGANVASAPALIQSTFGERGNFEVVARVVVREGNQEVSKLCHWWRANDTEGYPWSDEPTACFGQDITSAPALIQSTFGERGDFEVVVQEGTRLCHYWRANDKPDEHFPWSDSTACFRAN